MTVEVATYITNLQATNPPSSDPRAQGDDHLRLIKQVLQNTFPSASKAVYLPKGEIVSAGTVSMVLDATDQNNLVLLDTSSGNVTVTLPTGLAAADSGWSCEIAKTSSDQGSIVVVPASGSIFSRAGTTPSIRVGAYFEPARFVWTGTFWICVKPGVPIGTTINWDAATTPLGFLLLDGTVYGAATYAELGAVFGVTAPSNFTLRDKRGRVEMGSGTGAGLTARTLGTNYGSEAQALVTANLPPYTPSGSVSSGATTSQAFQDNASGTITPQGGGSQQVPLAHTSTFTPGIASSFSGNAQGGSSQAFTLIQPSIATQKLIRAC